MSGFRQIEAPDENSVAIVPQWHFFPTSLYPDWRHGAVSLSYQSREETPVAKSIYELIAEARSIRTDRKNDEIAFFDVTVKGVQTWEVRFSNPSRYVMLGEIEGEYEAQGPTIEAALESLIMKLRAGESEKVIEEREWAAYNAKNPPDPNAPKMLTGETVTRAEMAEAIIKSKSLKVEEP
jgi:hypothetical protein